jgi:hypothetical protein
MLDGLVWLDQHTPEFKLDRLQVGLDRSKVLGWESGEQLITDG